MSNFDFFGYRISFGIFSRVHMRNRQTTQQCCTALNIRTKVCLLLYMLFNFQLQLFGQGKSEHFGVTLTSDGNKFNLLWVIIMTGLFTGWMYYVNVCLFFFACLLPFGCVWFRSFGQNELNRFILHFLALTWALTCTNKKKAFIIL